MRSGDKLQEEDNDLATKSLADYHSNRSLAIKVTKSNLGLGLYKLKALSTNVHANREATKKLIIGSLSGSYDMDGQVNWKWDANTQGWVAETPPEHPLESVAEEVIAGYIFDVISSMKAVEEVIWKPERKDSEQTHKLVMDALKTLPNLRHIDVSVTWLRTPLDLDSVTSLQEIIMHEISETLQVDMFEGLAKAVAQNPQLHLIDIRNAGFYRRNIDEFQCLHQVFKYYPREAPPLRLRDLRMFECRFRLDDITIPHLQHLTSLQLLCVEEHCTLPSQPASQSGANLDRDLVLQGKDSFCSNLEDVWTAFRSIGVQLENISIDMVPSSFLDYLASYSGLKKLNIDLHKLRNSELSDSMAAKFYDKSIIGHTNTLEELILSTSYEGLWCIGPHNFKTLAQCKNMERLCIGVNLSQLPLPSDRNGDYKTAARSDIEHNLIKRPSWIAALPGHVKCIRYKVRQVLESPPRRS
ncbi:hypothetical protein JR316_0010080 [Psilocybe cubensis]|uniref:Uncharacterized protein n=1 Tax=Psilocybe cubensis TaxID=181762 RepID=A0ACB8GQF3_PSICU|nr:hypothetical protein JR316_0010080 [Psilocybe cubensis]KAH9477848.1 hypothetical protein JR316_0010080 [Psilocybe cubensis]